MDQRAIGATDSRSEVRRRLEAAADELALAGPTVLEIRGDTGLGKTHFIKQAAERARERGLVVAEVDGSASEIVLLTIDQLTRQLGGSGGETAAIERVGHLRHAIELADNESAGVLLALDDAHRLPPQDRAAIHDLLKLPPIHRLLIVAASDSGSPPTLTVARQSPEPGRELVLAPLGASEMTTLVSDWIRDGAAAHRFLVELTDLTNGNPRWATDLLRHIATLPQDERDAYVSGTSPLDQLQPPPELLSQLIGSTDQGQEALAVLRALAIIGWPATVPELARLTETSPGGIERMLTRLEDAGVVTPRSRRGSRGFQLQIPLAGLLLAQAMPSLLRRRVHRTAATLVEEGIVDQDDVLAVARHYIEGELELTPSRIEHVISAARELTARSRYPEARALLERLVGGLAVRPGSVVPSAALVLLAEALSRTGEITQARDMLLAAFHESNGAASVDRLIREVRDQVALGHEESAAWTLDAALDRGALSAHDRLRVGLERARVLQLRGLPDEALLQAEEVLSLAEELGESQVAAEAAISSHFNHLLEGRPVSALASSRRARRFARRIGETAMTARTLSGIGNALADARGPDRGARWLRRAHDRAEVVEDFATIAWTSMSLATALTEAGRWTEASQYAENAVRVDASLHRTRALRRSRGVQSRLSALRGESGGPDRLLDDAFEDDRYFGGPTVAIPDLIARFEHRMLAADYDGAAELTDEMLGWLDGWSGYARMLIIDVLPAAAEVGQMRGDRESVGNAVDRLERLAAGVQRELPVATAQLGLASARLAATSGDWAAAGFSARKAAALFAANGFRWRAALANAVAGRASVELGRPDEAASVLRSAYGAFRRMGATPRLGEVRGALSSIGRRPPRLAAGGDALTVRQLEVARLASRGRTDQAIADALGISRRTVTTHMHQILARTGLRSRRDLAEWLTRAD